MPHLERNGDVFVLNLGNEGEADKDIRFHPDWIVAVNQLLDEVEKAEGPAALVTTATGKIYNNGLDTDWLFGGGNTDKLYGYLDSVHAVYARLVAFPMPTVAAINGHAFGAGAMLATAHDFRVMRSDRGFWCLPEVNLGMTFAPAMNSLLRARLTNQTAVESMTTGRRYGGADALAAGIVDATADEASVLTDAVARAGALAANHKPNLAVIKRTLHSSLLAELAVETTAENLGAFAGI